MLRPHCHVTVHKAAMLCPASRSPWLRAHPSEASRCSRNLCREPGMIPFNRSMQMNTLTRTYHEYPKYRFSQPAVRRKVLKSVSLSAVRQEWLGGVECPRFESAWHVRSHCDVRSLET